MHVYGNVSAKQQKKADSPGFCKVSIDGPLNLERSLHLRCFWCVPPLTGIGLERRRCGCWSCREVDRGRKCGAASNSPTRGNSTYRVGCCEGGGSSTCTSIWQGSGCCIRLYQGARYARADMGRSYMQALSEQQWRLFRFARNGSCSGKWTTRSFFSRYGILKRAHPPSSSATW